MLNKKLSTQRINTILTKIRVDVEIDLVNFRKLLKKVKILEDKNCWVIDEDWTNYKFYNGQPAHRFTFRLFHEDIVGKNIICHHCDRPGCINPDHLYQGTSKTNFHDAIRRKRWIRSREVGRKIDNSELEKLKKLDKERDLQTPVEFLRATYAGRSSK